VARTEYPFGRDRYTQATDSVAAHNEAVQGAVLRRSEGRQTLPVAVLVTMWDGPGPLPLLQGECTTPQGAAIWALQTQTWAGGRLAVQSTIWRWPGHQVGSAAAVPCGS
jgi:hypothetical protein